MRRALLCFLVASAAALHLRVPVGGRGTPPCLRRSAPRNLAPPLMLAKKKKRKQQQRPQSTPAAPSAPAAAATSVVCPQDAAPGTPVMVQSPFDGQQYEVLVPDGVAPGQPFEVQFGQPAPEVPDVPFPLLVPDDAPPPPAMMPTSGDAGPAPMPSPAAAPSGEVGEEGLVRPGQDAALLRMLEEMPKPSIKLPSFEESLARGGGAGPPPTPERSSKLPPINPGVNPYEAELEPEKTPFEKLIFNGTWAAIFFLVAVEIFINTPLFQQIKPAVLNFLAGN